MTEREIETVDEALGWLRACSLYLADGREVRLSGRSAIAFSRTFARVARILGGEQQRRTAQASGSDFIAFDASGGPPSLAPRAHAVPLPQAGPNVVALIPAAVRRGDGAA